ncbi:MAG: 1,4-alpha-glucan branching protein GlgB [Clostridia bacterium]|nr:1,4-alpha-glucan branching protein GlgB [Clostridia bacterium]
MEKRTADDLPVYLFHQGTNYRSYELLGAHRAGRFTVFRTWAPHADELFLCGDFNGWSDTHAMRRVSDEGLWEISLPSALIAPFSRYKYRIVRGGRRVMKADPYAFAAELRPATASLFCELGGFRWSDKKWLDERKAAAPSFYARPLNIYEVHLGSWKRHEDGSFYSYRELAGELVPYAKDMGYTHLELMPVAEHPLDASWGYQVTGYYAPTARFGSPHDLMYLVNAAHRAGIGVILDWVPAHFPKDEHGLCEFDGGPLYEYQDPNRQEQKGWGTRCFDVGRNEVECFLVSNALFWAEQYHVDGLRVDAVASMLYLDYGREEGEWTPNAEGGNRSLEAIAFFRKLNAAMRENYPDVLTIAEESTAFPDVTRFDREGLGFSLKWNMGWMNDSLSYLETDPIYRSYAHRKITFPLVYAFSERFVLPVSHDEVVYGKRSLVDKAPGDYGAKFAQARLFSVYQMTMPGKKLSFMGNEIAQFAEWDFNASVEWFLLGYETHRRFASFIRSLNRFYLEHRQLWERDDGWSGFEWLLADDADDSVFAYLRRGNGGKDLVVVLNFTPVRRDAFLLPLPQAGTYQTVFSSADEFGAGNTPPLSALPRPAAGRNYSAEMTLLPFSAVILENNEERQGNL